MSRAAYDPAGTAYDQIERGIVRHPPDLVAGYRESGVWRGLTLGQELHVIAGSIPDRVAVVSGHERLTYRELAERTDRVAAGLMALGARPGERALFQTGNSLETVLAYFGCLKAGVIPVCTLPLHGSAEMSFMAGHTAARFLFVQRDLRDGALLRLALALREEHPALETVITTTGDGPGTTTGDGPGTTSGDAPDVVSLAGLLGSPAAEGALPEIDPGAVAVFQLSGGTTAVPKVIPRFHEEYAYNSRAFGAFFGWGRDTVVLHCLPLMHNAGIVVALQAALFAGGRFVIVAEANGSAVLDAIAAEGVTDIPCLPPAIASRMLAVDGARERLGSVERALIAGQRLPEALADRIESELGLHCLQSFGMGEGMISATPVEASERVRKHTVGRPVSDLDEIRILDIYGDAPEGEVGELACRGPYTIRGYYQAPERNAAAFTADGFYRTGDLARLITEDGVAYISVEGRIKDVINRGGEKINAEEVENLLVTHPAIDAVAVVSMPDPELGERACAYVTLWEGEEGLTLGEAVAYLRTFGIATYKLPERLEVLDALPLTNVGKVSKEALRRDISRRLAREA